MSKNIIDGVEFYTTTEFNYRYNRIMNGMRIALVVGLIIISFYFH